MTMFRTLALLFFCTLLFSCTKVESSVTFTIQGDPAFTPEKAEEIYQQFQAFLDFTRVPNSKIGVGTSMGAPIYSATSFARSSPTKDGWEDKVSLTYRSPENTLSIRVARTSDRAVEFSHQFVRDFRLSTKATISGLAGQEIKVTETSRDDR
jgi:hypothetical protein